jgi:hypothetical protein
MEDAMPVRDYEPCRGQAFQGDIAIIPMPGDIEIEITEEIGPVDGRLIIQESEATGHHHVIEFANRRVRSFRQSRGSAADLRARDIRLRRAFGGGRKHGTARLYRDPIAVLELGKRGILTRTDLAIGCLIVEGGPVVVSHEEHDGIRLPPGNYYLGRQAEKFGDEEWVVRD